MESQSVDELARHLIKTLETTHKTQAEQEAMEVLAGTPMLCPKTAKALASLGSPKVLRALVANDSVPDDLVALMVGADPVGVVVKATDGEFLLRMVPPCKGDRFVKAKQSTCKAGVTTCRIFGENGGGGGSLGTLQLTMREKLNYGVTYTPNRIADFDFKRAKELVAAALAFSGPDL